MEKRELGISGKLRLCVPGFPLKWQKFNEIAIGSVSEWLRKRAKKRCTSVFVGLNPT